MHMLDRRSVAAEPSGRRSEMAEDSEMDADSGTASVPDLEMGFEVDLVSTEGSGSTAGLDSVAVSDSADAGDAALVLDGVSVSVGDGIRGGDGAIRTIHTRIGEVMAGTGTMTPGLTVQT
jgi:hypothetical protein